MNKLELLNNIKCYTVIVTKKKTIEQIDYYYKNGYKDFGENTVQELLLKVDYFKDAKWHFIGRIQSNKIKFIVKHCELIHSVYSFKHAKIINNQAQSLNKIQKILIQVNISNEKTKAGILVDQLEKFIKEINNFKFINIQGIMVIGDHTKDLQKIQETFLKASKLKQKYHFKHLSMGMSNDYKIALANDTTIIRLGSILFKE